LLQAALADRSSKDQRPAVIAAAEGYLGRLAQVRQAWCGPGVCPEEKQQSVRDYLYGFVSVVLALGMMTTLVLPFSNTEMMNLFLKPVAQDFGDYFVVTQVDGAANHTAAELMISENTRLIVQPPRSPELNAMEYV
jgi:hypothetical protein